MTGTDDRWADERWLALDADDPDELDAYPELPPGQRIVHHHGRLHIATDLPDIANYQSS
jgi:hypothetical protein